MADLTSAAGSATMAGMWLENLVVDARDPRTLGAFWEAALNAERLTWSDELVELRVSVPHGPSLDVCLPRVADARPSSRLRLDLATGERPEEVVVARLRELGARPVGSGQRHVWADPEGGPFGLRRTGLDAATTGPIAAVSIESADPERDAAFWARLVGWSPASGDAPEGTAAVLRHPSGRGPVLEFRPETERKAAKSRLHLDARCDPGEPLDDAVARALDLGARRVDHDWGELPWVVLADPSGHEFCILPPPR